MKKFLFVLLLFAVPAHAASPCGDIPDQATAEELLQFGCDPATGEYIDKIILAQAATPKPTTGVKSTETGVKSTETGVKSTETGVQSTETGVQSTTTLAQSDVPKATVPVADVPTAAPAEGEELSWIVSTVKWSIDAWKNGNYMMVIGMLIMLLVWLCEKYIKVPKKWLALLSVGIGTVSGVGLNMLAQLTLDLSAWSWLDVILKGALTGLAASGGWSVAGKYLPDLLAKLTGKSKKA